MKRLVKVNFLILLVFAFSISSCGQASTSQKKSTEKIPVKDYFDNQNQILIKLYKKSQDGILYWETWNNDDKTALVHWGLLGAYGEQKPITTKSLLSLKDSVNYLIAEKINEGFSEISTERQFTLSITFKLATWGSSEDLNRREKYRNIITEHLGWTGNGLCDDGDIGSGEMTLYAEVVDPYTAIKTIPPDLLRNGVREDYHFTILQGDKIIAERILPYTGN